jgi:hypothetical protein
MKYLEPDEPHWYICCHGCGMETDVFPSIEQADAAWNRRAGQVHAAAGLLEALLTAKDYVSDAANGALFYEGGDAVCPKMAGEDLAAIRAAIAAAKGAGQ